MSDQESVGQDGAIENEAADVSQSGSPVIKAHDIQQQSPSSTNNFQRTEDLEEDHENGQVDDYDDNEDDFGDDFGDFGGADDDFGDFDNGGAASEATEPAPSTAPRPKLQVLEEDSFKNSARLQADVRQLIGPIFAKVKDNYQSRPAKDTYFSERSEALWNQLAVAMPHVSPIDWKRSSIRRLLLVSLGVPLNLDEILPKANTKRLVLPAVGTSRRRSSVGVNKSAGDAKSDETTQQAQDDDDEEQRIWQWHQLSNVSAEALEGMTDDSLESHIESLKEAIPAAKAILESWTAKKESSLKDKEAFEGVIESLVEYAQRLRRKA